MYKRMLRSVLATAFSVVVAWGALSIAAGSHTDAMSDSGWGHIIRAELSGAATADDASVLDSGWGSSAPTDVDA